LCLISIAGKNQSQDSLPDTDFLPTREKFELIIDQLCVDLARKPVLRDINLNFKSGEWVAVVGRNGVGKTTLLRALAGLQKFGGRIETISEDGSRPADFGMVFQNPDLQIFNASVREEILYRIPNPNMYLYDAIVKSLGLKIYEDTPPLLLSEGEKKRVGLAMVLMRQPLHGVLLDEPSLGQDSAHKEILRRMICKLVDSGQIVIMTTHDLVLASKADRIILLGDEGVIANDLTEKMLNNKKIWDQAGIRLPDWFMREWLAG
jgi:energy-coupling factor transporter ATP-binding protein EcfA2